MKDLTNKIKYDNTYGLLPETVMHDNDLSFFERMLYMEILKLSNKDGRTYASNAYLAELYQTTKTTIGRSLLNLEDKGYIEREVIYKAGTKQIETRYIYPLYLYSRESIPIHTDVDRVYTDKWRPIHTDEQDNNININNISVNKDILSVSDETNEIAPTKNKKQSFEKEHHNEFIEVIEYFNKTANKKLKAFKPDGQLNGNGKFIKKQLQHQYTVEDLKKVIAHKTKQWGNDEKMKKYLRPETLFNEQHFSGYLADAEEQEEKNVIPINKITEEDLLKFTRSVHRE